MRSSFTDFLAGIKCIEIGVGNGANALNMLVGVQNFKLYLVDSYDVDKSTFQFGKKFTPDEREEFIKSVRDRLAPFSDRVELIIQDSETASQKFSDEYFDYIYIDAQHEYEDVLRDVKAWYPKLKKGGTISGHDYGIEGVTKAVQEFFGRNYIYSGDDWSAGK